MRELEKALKWIAIGGVFALPFVCLIVANGSFFPYNFYFPYITGKSFTFRLLVEVMAGAYLALALVFPQYRPKRSWILGALSLFVLVIAIADAQGAVPFKSFWSNFERMDGWVTLVHLLLYVIVASALLDTTKLWKRLFQVNLGISLYLSLYGLMQIIGVTALGQPGAGGLTARIDATFGNPIYFAVYMLFNIFIAALLLSQALAERERVRLSPYFTYGTVIAADTLALLFTGTRGTTLGLVGGAIFALVVYVWRTGDKRIRNLTVGSIALLIVVAGGLYAGRGTDFVRHVGFLDRLATIGASDDATMKARFINWSIAWQGIKERPVFGWGQENYAIVFDKYYDPRMYAQEQWFDRVHNIVFDWLVAGGFVGFLSYVSIFVAALVAILRSGVFTKPEESILIGLLAGYSVHNFFVFDNITSYILFGTMLAYILWRTTLREAPLVAREFLPRGTLPFVALLCALLTWGSAWYVNAAALAANRTLISAIDFRGGGDVSSHLELFKQAANPRTMGTQEAREQLAQISTALVSQSSVDVSVKQAYLQTAASEMLEQSKLSPLDARFPLFLGLVLESGGDYPDADTALKRALELSPKKQAILIELAQVSALRGDQQATLSYLKQAHELDTSYRDARLIYAAAALRFGDDALAKEILGDLIESGDAADPRILAAYANRNDFAGAIPIWAAHVEKHSDDAQGYFTLAALYYRSGQTGKAIATLEQAKQRVPSTASQADSLISDIRAGKPIE